MATRGRSSTSRRQRVSTSKLVEYIKAKHAEGQAKWPRGSRLRPLRLRAFVVHPGGQKNARPCLNGTVCVCGHACAYVGVCLCVFARVEYSTLALKGGNRKNYLQAAQQILEVLSGGDVYAFWTCLESSKWGRAHLRRRQAGPQTPSS
jgi:hypothetical protein